MRDERPDIAVLGYDLRGSGVVRNAIRIAGAAAASGLSAELWVASDEGQLRSEIPSAVKLRVIAGGSTRWGRTVGLARAIPGFAKQLRALRPRIALSSGNHMHLAAALAYARAGRPSGVALWARASNATLKHPLAAALGRPLPAILGQAVDRVNRLQYRGFARVIAVCHELGTHLVEELGLPKDTVSVIPNGVDVSAIAHQSAAALEHPWMQDGAPPVILAAGRLSRQKNFADLIRALPLVLQKHEARLVILGGGSETDTAALQKLAASLGVEKHMLCAGFDPNPFRWMARARVLAVSSRWEGSSNVVIEALACGTPVVAYRCPTGIAEVVEPLGKGHVVPPGDVKAMAVAIIEALSSPASRQALMAHAGRFDLAGTLAAYVANFQSALAVEPRENVRSAS